MILVLMVISVANALSVPHNQLVCVTSPVQWRRGSCHMSLPSATEIPEKWFLASQRTTNVTALVSVDRVQCLSCRSMKIVVWDRDLPVTESEA